MALCDHWILCFLLVSSRRKMESISLFLQFDWANLGQRLILEPKSGLPGSLVVRIRLPSRRHGFDLWVKDIPWRRKWQDTPGFFSGKCHGRGAWWAAVHGVEKEQDTTEETHTHTHTHTHSLS